MKIAKVKYGETIPNPCVNYASFRPEFEIDLPDNATEEDVMEAIEYAKHLCHKSVEKALEIDKLRDRKILSLKTLEREIEQLENLKKQMLEIAQQWTERPVFKGDEFIENEI